MTYYKHTQIGYLMIVVTLAVLAFFVWAQIMARLEAPSVDSGANFAMTVAMLFFLLIPASFTTLTVTLDERELEAKFGFGFPRKKIILSEIAQVTQVRNRWYHGWGIHAFLWPRMTIYNVSGFNAVELKMKNDKIYRIGTDEPEKLVVALKQALKFSYL